VNPNPSEIGETRDRNVSYDCGQLDNIAWTCSSSVQVTSYHQTSRLRYLIFNSRHLMWKFLLAQGLFCFLPYLVLYHCTYICIYISLSTGISISTRPSFSCHSMYTFSPLILEFSSLRLDMNPFLVLCFLSITSYYRLGVFLFCHVSLRNFFFPICKVLLPLLP
jgi:hypothetical protein